MHYKSAYDDDDEYCKPGEVVVSAIRKYVIE